MHILCLVMLRKTAAAVSHIEILDSCSPAQRRESEVFWASTQPVVHLLHRGFFPPRNAVCACFSHVCLVSVLLTAQSAQACCRSFETGCNLFCIFSLSFHTGCVFPGAASLVPKKTGDPHRDTIWSLPEAVNSSTWPGQAAACSCVLGGGKTGWRKIGQNS